MNLAVWNGSIFAQTIIIEKKDRRDTDHPYKHPNFLRINFSINFYSTIIIHDVTFDEELTHRKEYTEQSFPSARKHYKENNNS